MKPFLLATLMMLSGFYASAQSAVNTTSTHISENATLEDFVGAYQQPVWTASRSFSASRTYLIPQDTVETEFWIRTKTFRDTNQTEYLYQQEIEWGIARHLQLDFYVNEIKSPEENLKFEGVQLELRYAFGDWNQVFLNPTLYFEYHPKNVGTDAAEVRLLLAQSLTPQWHFSANLAYETELFNEETHEYAITMGTARSLNKTFALGLEAKSEWVDVKDNRGHMTNEDYAGPSIQWKPTPSSHVDFAFMGGLNNDSNSSEGTLIFGQDL
jgi:hypothetical protein